MILIIIIGTIMYIFEGIGGENPGFQDIPNSIYWSVVTLTTVGYGTGALLGRGEKNVKDLHWNDDLGLGQAMWVLEVINFEIVLPR